jgi:hypothetical protein
VNDDLIEKLSDIVHQQWMAEKQRQGFADHVFSENCHAGCPAGTHDLCRDDKCYTGRARHHADMLPYAELTEHIKEYDRVTVRGVLAGLKSLGYEVI